MTEREHTHAPPPLPADRPFDPRARVKVPAHRAGPGGDDCYQDVLDTLAAAGWSGTDDELANYYMRSPDGDVRFAFLPETPGYLADDVLWKVTVTPRRGMNRGWHATFGGDTPTEAIIAFLAVITHPDGLERHPDDVPATRGMSLAGEPTVGDEPAGPSAG